MNYYEHHLGDYDGATAHLTWLEDCAYRRLICLYYRTERPLPADTKQVCRLVRATSKAERAAVLQVLEEFFELQDDGWHHDRCDAEIARFQEKSEKARRSVAKRWEAAKAEQPKSGRNTNVSANVDTNVSRPYSDRNTPRARPQTPDPRPQTPVVDGGGTPERPSACAEGSPPAPPTPPSPSPPPSPSVPARTIRDWSPRATIIEALTSPLHGVPRQFVEEQILEFRTYWQDRGGSADSWDAKFLQRCAGQWKRYGHEWVPRPAPPVQRQSAFDALTDRSWAAGLVDETAEPPDDDAPALIGWGGEP